jgi:hypothetical protein
VAIRNLGTSINGRSSERKMAQDGNPCGAAFLIRITLRIRYMEPSIATRRRFNTATSAQFPGMIPIS